MIDLDVGMSEEYPLRTDDVIDEQDQMMDHLCTYARTHTLVLVLRFVMRRLGQGGCGYRITQHVTLSKTPPQLCCHAALTLILTPGPIISRTLSLW
jgi:hypothetical protein